jgi:hypothetical protein
MSPDKTEAGAPDPGSAQHRACEALRLTDQQVKATAPDRHGRDLPTVAAVPPTGRRALWMWWVARCALCGSAHLHRAGSSVGGVRGAGCGRGTYYARIICEQRQEVAA